MQVLAFLLTAYGLCFGLINKAAFLRRFEFLERMFECSYCTGFHAGWLTYLLYLNMVDFEIAGLIVSAFSSAAFCYIMDTAVIYIEERTASVKASKPGAGNLFG